MTLSQNGTFSTSQEHTDPAVLPDTEPQTHRPRLASLRAALPIILYAIVLYSVRVSFALRPGRDERLLPLMFLLFISTAVGGWALQWLAQMTASGWRSFPRGIFKMLPLAAVLLILPLCSAFGYRVWLTCEPLRYLSAIGYGLMLPTVNYVLFTRVSPHRRGLWFGLITSIGLLTWWVLIRVSANWDGQAWRGFTSGLLLVFVVHTTFVLLLAWSLWRILMARPGAAEPAYPVYFGAVDEKTRTRNISLLLSAGLVLCLMNGFLEAKLFPVLLIAPKPIWPWLMVLLVILSPLFGILLDRNPDHALPAILKKWAWFFILAPALIVMGEDTVLYRPLHVICTVGQVVLLVVLTTALAGYAKNGWSAAALTGLLFSFRILALFWAELLGRLPEFTAGASILCATLLAFIYYHLVTNVKTGPLAVSAEVPVPESREATDPVDGGKNLRKDAIERFISERPLTPREHEVGIMIMNGATSREIAMQLGISEYTVNSHVKNLLDKFGVSSRRALFGMFTKS
jgi:Response regulator containing a CheY-like receiver domain and an HTH DNA-binding domain